MPAPKPDRGVAVYVLQRHARAVAWLVILSWMKYQVTKRVESINMKLFFGLGSSYSLVCLFLGSFAQHMDFFMCRQIWVKQQTNPTDHGLSELTIVANKDCRPGTT